jgi:hypothetical protein
MQLGRTNITTSFYSTRLEDTRAHRYFQTSLLTRGLPISSCLILFRSQSRRTCPDGNPSGHQTYHPVRPRHVLYADVEGDQALEALQASIPGLALYLFSPGIIQSSVS